MTTLMTTIVTTTTKLAVTRRTFFGLLHQFSHPPESHLPALAGLCAHQ
jgi:hypothetical protein